MHSQAHNTNVTDHTFTIPVYSRCKPHQGMQRRTQWLFKISNRLRYLAGVYDIPVVVTNQVTSRIATSSFSFLEPRKQLVCHIPSMGMVWSNCVNTR